MSECCEVIPGGILAGRDKGKRKMLKGRSIFLEETEVLNDVIRMYGVQICSRKTF